MLEGWVGGRKRVGVGVDGRVLNSIYESVRSRSIQRHGA